MKSKLLLASLFSAVALTACGGSGGADATDVEAPAPAASPAPAPAPAVGSASFDAVCPSSARKLTMASTILSNANMSVTNDNATLNVKMPAGVITVQVCPVGSATPGFPATPASLTALLTGAPAAAVIATGEFDRLTNKQLDITYDFGSLSADAIAAKAMVAYTINSSGAWTRTPLATTFAAGSTATSRVVTAPIEQVGFYTIE